LHEVAKILGSEQTEDHLLSTFELFLKDLDEVKFGVVSRFTDFLTMLSPATRKRFLPALQELQMSKNWRFRKALAKQLGSLCNLFELEDLEQHVIPLALALCQDQYANVRSTSSKFMGVLLVRLRAEESQKYDLVEKEILGFAVQNSYSRRQLFLQVCQHLVQQFRLLNSQQFEDKYLPLFIVLSDDPVPNVRISLAHCLSRIKQSEQFADHPGMKEILQKLASDKDTDVREAATKAMLALPGSTSHGNSSNNQSQSSPRTNNLLPQHLGSSDTTTTPLTPL